MNTSVVKPRYTDGNIGLAALAPYHASLFFDWINDSRVRKMRDFDAYPFGIQDAEKYVASHLKDKWLIVLKDDENKCWIPVGYAGLSIRQRHRVGILGYAIGNKAYEGKGFATKAVGLIIQWAFDDLDLVAIHASTISSNTGSIRVLQKSGFVQVGKYNKARFESGQRYDELLFEFVRCEKE